MENEVKEELLEEIELLKVLVSHAKNKNLKKRYALHIRRIEARLNLNVESRIKIKANV